MKPAVESNELIERMRHAASRENGFASPALEDQSASDQPPIAEPFPLPTSPTATSAQVATASRPEILLDEAASFVRGGRAKNSVAQAVPRWLRPLFRNQGGYNSVVLEAVERLVETSRTLRQQDYDLYDRMMDFQTWAHAVAEISAENRKWMLAAGERLEALSEERWSQLEERIGRLEEGDRSGFETRPHESAPTQPSHDAERLAWLTAHVEVLETERRALNEHLGRLRAQIDEQAAYIRTVHQHLDQLGAHVDATLGRPS